MVSPLQPDERRAIAVVAVIVLVTLGMLGVII